MSSNNTLILGLGFCLLAVMVMLAAATAAAAEPELSLENVVDAESPNKENGGGGGEGGDIVKRRREKRADDFAASEVELQKLAQHVTQQDSEIQALKNQLTQMQIKLQASGKQVGFHAYRASTRFTLTYSSTLVLDRTHYNVGSAYDTHTGTFTAPVAGVYAFFLTLRSYHDPIYLDITLNGTGKSRVYVTNNTATGSASVYLHANKGDRVWVKSITSGTHDVYGLLYTHFSGFLVQPDP